MPHAAASTVAQADLFGAAEPRHSLFFALLPDAAEKQAMARAGDELRSAHGLSGKPIAAARYHLTLVFLGESAEPRPDMIEAACRVAIGLRVPAFECVLDACASFHGGNRSPCVLLASDEMSPVRAFQRQLRDALLAAGLKEPASRPFVPHVTLGYYRQQIESVQAIRPIRWPVRDFALLQGVHGQPQYVCMGRWSLR